MDPSLLQKVFLRYGIMYFVFYLLVGSVVISAQNWRMRGEPGKRVNFWRFLLLGLVLLAIFLVGTLSTVQYMTPKKTWTAITSEEGGFTASFPGSPKTVVEQVPAPSGSGTVPTTAYMIDGGSLGVTYTIFYMDYPAGEAALQKNARRMLEESRNQTVLPYKLKLKSSEFITQGASQGIDYIYQSPTGVGVTHTRTFIKGARIYQVWAGPLTDKDDPNGTQFFESFQLIAPKMGPAGPKTEK